VDVNVKVGKMAIPFGLYSELNATMDTVHVVKEFRQLAWAMGPDDERVIHVAKLAERLVGRPLQNCFLQVLQEEVAMTGDSGEPMAIPSVCS
jgi:hypothetical protein